MLWMIHCIAKPNAEAARKAGQPEHRPYLKSNEKIVLFAGPLLGDDGETRIGNLYMIHANSREEANAFSDNEPFTKAGVFQSVTITRVRKGQFNPQVMDLEKDTH